MKYIEELSDKIDAYRKRFRHAPVYLHLEVFDYIKALQEINSVWHARVSEEPAFYSTFQGVKLKPTFNSLEISHHEACEIYLEAEEPEEVAVSYIEFGKYRQPVPLRKPASLFVD